MIQHLLHGPFIPYRNEVRRHQPADAVFRIPEQIFSFGPFFRREQLQQLCDGAARQLLQQGGAIVRRHFVDDLDDLLLPHCLKQPLLIVAAQVFEGLSG